jgi:hypothetical protein
MCHALGMRQPRSGSNGDDFTTWSSASG